jgi:hypothetical protein
MLLDADHELFHSSADGTHCTPFSVLFTIEAI